MQTAKGSVQHVEPAHSPLYQFWAHTLEKNEGGI